MKLPLHRSITFWAGILVITFICWAWWDSTQAWSYGTYGRWTMANAGCGVMIGRHGEWKPGSTERWAHLHELELEGPLMTWPLYFRQAPGESAPSCLERNLREYGGKERTILELLLFSVARGGPGDWARYIPHWLILLAVALPWSALLLWRARRRKRALEKNPEPAPS